MRSLIDFSIRHRIIGAALLLVITLALGYEATKVLLNADFTTYLRKDDPLVQEFNYIGDEYAGNSMALVLIEADDVFSNRTLRMISELTDLYEETEGVAYVTSLTNVLDFKKTEWGLDVGKLIKKGAIPENKEELQRLRDYVLSKEMYVKDLVSEDGKSTVIVVRLKGGVSEFDVTGELQRKSEKFKNRAEVISFGGFPFLLYQMTMQIINNLEYLEPLMLFLMFGILFLAFRSKGGVILPMAVVGFSIVWTVGLMSMLGLEMNMLTGIMPIILIAMASADGIHVMRRYYEKRHAGGGPVEAIKDTFSELAVPIIITTLTTMIGFLSLLISDFDAIKQFGFVTALGVFMALVITFLIFPVFISFARRPHKEERKMRKQYTAGRFVARWAEFVVNRRKGIVIATGILVVIAAAIIPMVEKDVDWSLCLQKGTKAHRAEMVLRRDYGGTLPIQALVKGSIKDPFTLKSMRYLERYLETVPSVEEARSIAGVISEMNEVMNDRYVVPATSEGVANLWFLIEDKDIFEQMVKKNEMEGLVQAKLDTWKTGLMSEAVDNINRFVESLPKKIVVVNLNDVSPEVKAALLKIRGERITNNLMLDISKRRIKVDRKELEAIVKNALFDEGLTKGGYNEVREKIVGYLLSEEAEVEGISKTDAAAIAGSIAEKFRVSAAINRDEILAVVESYVKEASLEDMSELAKSLEVAAKEAAGEARTALVIEKIKKLLPAGSERFRDLSRDLKGDLWEINEELTALTADEYKAIPFAIDSSKIKEIPISFENTGLAAVLKKMEEELVPTQVLSLIIALVLVAVILGLLFRSPALGIIGIIPIALTIMVNFMMMGILGVGLDSFTAMIASVAIGLGIDTDVHFLSCFKREFLRLGDELKALKNTFSTTGMAILINTLTVGAGFAVLMLSGGQHVRRFGGLVALTVFVSALFTFTVLPAITLSVKPGFLKKGG